MSTSLRFRSLKTRTKSPKIRVSAEPNHFSGHFYFPLYKGERVLLDMFFQRASIARYLDWRAKLPLKLKATKSLWVYRIKRMPRIVRL